VLDKIDIQQPKYIRLQVVDLFNEMKDLNLMQNEVKEEFRNEIKDPTRMTARLERLKK